MPFDPLIANAGRLRILTALAVEERQEFVHLRRSTQLTDGNLAAHAKRLQLAGLIEIDKEFREGKPVTSYLLTSDGRRALESHARRLIAAISHRRLPTTSKSAAVELPVAPLLAKTDQPQPRSRVVAVAAVEGDDWVD